MLGIADAQTAVDWSALQTLCTDTPVPQETNACLTDAEYNCAYCQRVHSAQSKPAVGMR